HELGMDHPFHVGVTEAGDGEDGRIKSAIGIGSLLEDGIGDTIRVSLTEEPEFEVPVCYDLAKRFQPGAPRPKASRQIPEGPFCKSLFDYERRKSRAIAIGPFLAGDAQLVRVVTYLPPTASAQNVLSILEAQLKAAKGADPEILEFTIRYP